MSMEILKFHATWCEPCKLLSKKLEILKQTCLALQKATITEIDVDENDDLVEEYHIQNVPTLIIKDKNLKEPIRLVGLCGDEQMKRIFERIENQVA